MPAAADHPAGQARVDPGPPGGDRPGVGGGDAATAGYLQTAMTLPYVLSGPVIGNALDRVARPRRGAVALAACSVAAAGPLLAFAGRSPLALALAVAVGALGLLTLPLLPFPGPSASPDAALAGGRAAADEAQTGTAARPPLAGHSQ